MSKASSPYFVEFVGVPGSGKSTLANNLACLLEDEGYHFHNPVFKVSQRFSISLLRYLTKFPYVLSGLLSDKQTLFRYSKAEGFKFKHLKLLFNWFFVKGVYNNFSKQKGVTLYEQGLIQAFWSFILSEPKEKVTIFKNLLFEEYSEVNGLIVCVESDINIIEDRLSNRVNNTSRIKTGKNAKFDVNDAFSSYKEVIKTVDKLVYSQSGVSKLTVSNEDQKDIQRNIDIIKGEIPH